jgi:transcriptional regulator GlxA family with amidase domain
MKSIAILLFDHVEVLDFTGPFEVFSITGQRKVGEPFHVFTVAEKKTIVAKNNLIVQPTYLLDECPPCDIFLVPGGGGFHPDGKPFGTRYEMDNTTLLMWVKARAAKAELVLSVCSGALILAKAGLLENKEATTHFMAVDLLKSIAPTTKVSPEKRWVDNGRVVLSAGVSAGIDMALYIVERLQGKEVANETARYMQYDYWEQTPVKN